MELSLHSIRDLCGLWVVHLEKLMNYFIAPVRSWAFDIYWIPEHSLIGGIYRGLLDTIIGPFLQFSLLEIMLGVGLVAYLTYQLLIWVLNLVT